MARMHGGWFGGLLGLVALAAAPASQAQSPASGLNGVQGGGQGGIFNIPRVDAHGRGIPGVTRPMLMAGPVGGMGVGMGNGGGGGGGMQVNPNWVGAAALFMPQLLTGNGANNAGASAQNPVGNRVMGGLGAATPQSTAGRGQVAGLTAPMDGKRASLVLPPALVRPTPAAVDPAIADARLLAHQRDQAGQGAPSAQLALARRYATGNGVEANPAIARVWLEAAARNGSEEAKAELSTAHVLKPDSAGRASESPGTTVF